jgi:hypothetical protein
MDVVDMIRLNDINTNSDINQTMQRRARVAAVACPDMLIDTDNWPMNSRANWRRYLHLQPRLGVPALYYATHIDATLEPLTQRDYQMIRETWAAYRQQNGLASGNPEGQNQGLRSRLAGFQPRTRLGRAIRQAIERWVAQFPHYELG